MQATPAVQVPAAAAERAGFLVRTVAFLLDSLLIVAVSGLLGGGGGPVLRGGALTTLFGLVYFVFFWSSAGGGQTLAMRLLGLRVVRADGVPLGAVGAIVRWAGLIVSFAVLFLGVLWVIFDGRKQGWHDKLASTYVIKV